MAPSIEESTLSNRHMINFFRKIRYSLMSDAENKSGKSTASTGKYLKYAIGETLLVVIGIIIALQLNMWNEGRKNEKLEKYYVNRIIADLNSDLEEIEQIERFAQRNIAVGLHILTFFGEDYLTELRSMKGFDQNSRSVLLESAVQNYPSLETFNFNAFGESLGYVTAKGREIDIYDYTYRELLASGKFEIIRDPIIREKISYYWNKYQDLISVQDVFKDASDRYKTVLNDLNIPYANTLSSIEVVKMLGNQDAYKAALKNLVWSYLRGVAFFSNTKENAKALKLELEDYLATLD